MADIRLSSFQFGKATSSEQTERAAKGVSQQGSQIQEQMQKDESKTSAQTTSVLNQIKRRTKLLRQIGQILGAPTQPELATLRAELKRIKHRSLKGLKH